MSNASRQVWNWREPRTRDIHASVRRRGMVAGLVALVIGTVLNKVLGHALAGKILVALGAAQVMVALWRPGWLRPVLGLFQQFGILVGRGLAWLLLGALWLLVMVPGGIWLRLRGRDPLHRAPLADGLTAWVPRRYAATAESSERQFIEEDRLARGMTRPVSSLPDESILAELDEQGGTLR